MVINHMSLIDGILIPEKFKNKLLVASDCKLSSSEIKLFNIAIHEVCNVYFLEHENKINQNDVLGVNIFFSISGNIFYSKDKSLVEFGSCFRTIVYFMDVLRELQNEQFLFFTYIEELVHHFWMIEDEFVVKKKAIEIAQRFDKNITLELLKEWSVIGTERIK